MFRANKDERPGQIKTSVLAKGLLTAFVALSFVSTVGAAGKGKPQGPRNTGEITIEVNPVTCDVYVQSEKDISNVIYNGVKEEYLYDDGVASPIGNTYKIGTYADLLGVTEDVIYVKAGNNGRRGVGAPYAIEFDVESACEGIDWGTCPCQETGQAWALQFDAATFLRAGDLGNLVATYDRDNQNNFQEYTSSTYRDEAGLLSLVSAEQFHIRPGWIDCGTQYQTQNYEPDYNPQYSYVSVGTTHAQSIQGVRDCRAGLDAFSNTQ